MWHSNFTSVDSNNKKSGVSILYVCFLFHFSSYPMLLYSTELSVHNGLEIFFEISFTTDIWEAVICRKADTNLT